MRLRDLLGGAALGAALLVAAPARADGPDKPAAEKPPEKAKADKDKKDKKPASPAPRRVYTEEDLKKYSEDPEAKAKSKTDAAASASPAEAPDPEAAQADQVKEAERLTWKLRAKDARERVAEATNQVAALETKIAQLRDDVAPGGEMEAFRLQRIEAEKRAAMEELEAAKKELATAREKLDALLLEAKRANIPHAWVNEP